MTAKKKRCRIRQRCEDRYLADKADNRATRSVEHKHAQFRAESSRIPWSEEESADGKLRVELIATDQLEGAMEGQLLGVMRRNLAGHHESPLDFLDAKVPDSAIGGLPDTPFDEIRERVGRGNQSRGHVAGLLASAERIIGPDRSVGRRGSVIKNLIWHANHGGIQSHSRSKIKIERLSGMPLPSNERLGRILPVGKHEAEIGSPKFTLDIVTERFPAAHQLKEKESSQKSRRWDERIQKANFGPIISTLEDPMPPPALSIDPKRVLARDL